jgi:hypothetical protein
VTGGVHELAPVVLADVERIDALETASLDFGSVEAA